tara:strand:+ start:113 stop:451 length:339 start_codon:yes stop_codon:yes gene_type:complete
MSEPSLVSSDTKFFLSETLKQCHKVKEKYYSYVYNVGAFIFLILLFGTILIVKYRGKPTEQERNEKNSKQKEYVLSKIKIMQDIKRQKSQDLITNLPKWETDEDIFNRKIYR